MSIMMLGLTMRTRTHPLGCSVEKIEAERAKQREQATIPDKGEKGFQPVVVSNETSIGKAMDFAAHKVGLLLSLQKTPCDGTITLEVDEREPCSLLFINF